MDYYRAGNFHHNWDATCPHPYEGKLHARLDEGELEKQVTDVRLFPAQHKGGGKDELWKDFASSFNGSVIPGA